MGEMLKKNEEIDDKASFNSMYQKYYRPVVNYISRLSNYQQSGEEIAQEVFIKLFKNLKTLPNYSIKKWLYTVAHNETINHFKKNSVPTLQLEEQGIELVGEDTTSNDFSRQIQRKMIREAFLKLPKSQAAALYLKDIDGYTYHEIAKTMGISYKAVKSLIFRGRQNFMKYYEEMSRNEL